MARNRDEPARTDNQHPSTQEIGKTGYLCQSSIEGQVSDKRGRERNYREPQRIARPAPRAVPN